MGSGSGGGAGTRELDRARDRFGSSLDLHPPLHPADDAATFGLPLQRAWFSETTGRKDHEGATGRCGDFGGGR
jgi:hypothetical protein